MASTSSAPGVATVHLPAGSELPSAALATLPTPCLVVARPALERNLAVAARQAAGTSLRPHFKAHKCTRLLREQLSVGPAAGATCATAAEAEVVVAAGVTDVLVANEVIDPAPLALVAELAGRATVTIAVDSVQGLDVLERAAAAAGTRVGVLVDLDVGQHRCGLPPGDPLVLELARRAAASRSLELRGLMGYEGHAQHEHDAPTRADLAAEAAGALARERDRLAAARLPSPIVSGGGTGTLAAHGELGVMTEIQAGSYPLLDCQYGDLDLGFETSMWCLATVVSSRPGAAVANAGLKHLACEDGPPRALLAGAAAGDLSDEHTMLQLEPGLLPAVGDRVLLAPRHLDPTVNLHPHLYVCDAAGDVERWDVDGRRTV